mgnify:FL=1|tara:strand:+ start:4584 stop:5990 length:1407 start_codon:yes stop_codon:yes gene_type:complete
MDLNNSHDDVEVWGMDADGMMGYYQAMSYTLGQSIADLVDNAYDAEATEIDIQIDLDLETKLPYIRILDNGNGISQDDMNKAMRLGLKRERMDSELGVYGIGMKLSALSQAHEVTVASQKSDSFSLRRISAHHIRQTNRNELLKYPTESSAYTVSKAKFDKEEWSTMILLEDVHQASKWQEMNKSENISLDKEMKKVKIHLGLTYHRIIEENKSTMVKLNGKTLQAQDPFMSWEKDIDYGTVKNDTLIPVQIDGKTVNVKSSMAIIPHNKRMTDSKRCNQINAGYKKKNFMQGFYLYRNKRLIHYGEWQGGMFGENTDPHNCLAKMLIDIPPEHSTWFGLGPTKTNVDLPQEFLRKIHSVVEEKRSWKPIRKGKKMSFYEAFQFRYNNEGKKNSTKMSLKSTGSTAFPLTSPVVPAPPGQATKSRPKTSRPKPIITEIKEEENTLILTVDKSNPSYEGLRAQLRMWEP